MRILIFTPRTAGHHLEYLHHLYDGAKNKLENNYFFLVPNSFKEVKNELEWETAPNIEFIYLTEKESIKCNTGNYFSSSYRKCTTLKKYILNYQITHVILITLVHYLPFLPLILPKKVKVSGIIYRLYLYEWKSLPFIKKIKDVLEMYITAKSNMVEKGYILNDSSAACYYNKLFKTTKFVPLADPIQKSNYIPQCIKKSLNISNDKYVYLHFGGMTKRKGTLVILDSIERMSKNDRNKFVFIFAGHIRSDIKSQFYNKYETLKSDTNLILFDEFCSYEKLMDLCYSCNAILIPYENTSFSSGVLGYAALFNKPVIGPADGLLGKLIRRNKLGITINEINSANLAHKILQTPHNNTESKKYTELNSIKAFQEKIL